MAVQFSETRPYFAKTLALKNLLGERAFSDFKRLMDPCCGIGLDKICISPCGGGGTPSLPLNSVQYNNAGAFFGDFAFTRDPITKDTIIAKFFTNDEAGSLQITDAKTSVQSAYNNTVTGEKSCIAAGGQGVSGQIAVEISYEDGANLLGDLVLNSSGNTITWDADTTDTITTTLQQNQDILGLGLLSGSALTWEDSGTEIVGFVGAGDASGTGLFPGTAMMGTSSKTTGASAIIATNYDNVNNIAVAIGYVANGDFESSFSFDDANALIQYKNGTTGFGSYFKADISGAITRHKLNTATDEYSTQLSNGLFQFFNSTTASQYMALGANTGIYQFGDISGVLNSTLFSINDTGKIITSKVDGVFTVEDGSASSILYIDAANRQSIFGNVAVAGGIKVFIDETNGINVQAPGSVVNVGDGGAAVNGTNIKVDDLNQLITITNVPTYADDAAAGVGGLTTGQLYKTTSGGSTFLKIVP